MVSEMTVTQAQIQQLEKENRILRKKLQRSEATCLQLEETTHKKESLLRQVINELQDSQNNLEEQKTLYASLERQSRELEDTIHALKQTQAQLIQAEKMSSLGQLVAGIAHEINNPVNFIHGNIPHAQRYTQELLHLIELYQHHYPQPGAEIQTQVDSMDIPFIHTDLTKVLNSMQMGTNRIRQIVLSLRNFSRMDEAEYKRVNIHEGIDSTLLILQHRLKVRDNRPTIQVNCHYGDLPLIECYPSQLNQVFMNILANAIDALQPEIPPKNSKYHPQAKEKPKEKSKENPGQITIQTSILPAPAEHGDWVQILIADDGIGMPQPIQQQIFNPFFTTKAVGQGTGMGLPISYKIVTEKHGGKLEFTSTPGQGTEFAIKIPICQSNPITGQN